MLLLTWAVLYALLVMPGAWAYHLWYTAEGFEDLSRGERWVVGVVGIYYAILIGSLAIRG